jgi:hypothetical protein
MKLHCPCGYRIVDQTDALPRKAHLLPDTRWLEFWDAIDEAIEQPGTTARERDAKCMEVRRWWHAFKHVYECEHCGRLHVRREGSWRVYVPEG